MRILAWLLIVLFQGYYGVTKLNRPCIIFNSRDPDKPNVCYKFIKIQRKNKDNCYKCSHCISIKDRTKNGFRIQQIEVKHGDIFETDPEEPGRHCCTCELIARLRGCELLQDVAHENRNTGLSGRQIIKKFEDARMGFDRNICRTISEYTKLETAAGTCEPGNISTELQQSLLQSGSIVKVNRAGERKFMFLMDDKSKEIIRRCKHIVLDGTFEKRPFNIGITQMYNFIAVFPELPKKSFACLVAVGCLSNKDIPAYDELFDAFIAAMDGDVGEIKEFHIDQEAAVISVLKRKFPASKIRLCNFHYNKNIRDYINHNVTALLMKNEIFMEWLSSIIGASFLPLNMQTEFINFKLQNPPRVPRELQQPLRTFLAYYRDNWLSKLEYINYYDCDGPRTTNHCEGFHNSLNSIIPIRRPDFRYVYMALREELKHSIMKYSSTKNGTNLPPRAKNYVISETNIMRRRDALKQKIEENHPDVADNEWIAQYCKKQAKSSSVFIIEALENVVAEEAHDHPQQQDEAEPAQQLQQAQPQNQVDPYVALFNRNPAEAVQIHQQPFYNPYVRPQIPPMYQQPIPYYQHYIPQQNHQPQMNQPPIRQQFYPTNLNTSLPVYFNHPQQFNYYPRPPSF